MITKNDEILRASTTTEPRLLAGAIARILRRNESVDIESVGAGAVNQTVKAIAIARGYLVPGGIDIVCVPSFVDTDIEGEERTGIRMSVARYRR